MIAAATRHVPVLLDEILENLTGGGRRLLLDGTLGLGGHAAAWLEHDPDARLLGLDRDPDMLEQARERLAPFGERARLFVGSYADAPEIVAEAGEERVDAILLDVGVASPHLDDAGRGFSLDADGPLDMRFDRTTGRTAEDLVRDLPMEELARILYEYGEERRSRAIARRIVEARRLGPIRSTLHLASLVIDAVGRGGRIHPATRTFQSLRIAVNDELGHLERGLAALPELLRPGGRIAVVSFHSLEDRRVKNAFRDAAREGGLSLETRKPIVPDDEEIRRNPRSRSARLRVAERTEGAGMRVALVALGFAACLAVAIRTVSIRVEIVRAGYVRSEIERQIAEEREVIQCLHAAIAVATAPGALRTTADRLGIELIEREIRRTVRAGSPEYAEDPRRHLARR